MLNCSFFYPVVDALEKTCANAQICQLNLEDGEEEEE